MSAQNMNKNNISKISLADDIQLMLWGLGDSQKPLLTTAKAIEIVIKKCIDSLIHQVNNIPRRRNSSKISIKDLLLAMKDQKSKLSRLLQYLEVKDSLELNVKKRGLPDLMDPSMICNTRSINKTSALNYLSKIGVNDIEDYMKNEGTLIERKIRADRISRSLDIEDYMAFSKSRTLSFVSSVSKKKKFTAWLKCINNPGVKRLKKSTVDVIAYLAKDSIAELVDIVLFQRKHGKVNRSEPKTSNKDMYSVYNFLTAKVDKMETDLPPITPQEIKSASLQLFKPSSGV